MQSHKHEIHLVDYQKPEFFIEHIDLTIELDDTNTLVSSTIDIHRNPNSTNKNLVLDGKNLKLESVMLDGIVLKPNKYQVTDSLLTIFNVPEKFQLKTKVKINPAANTDLDGLFKSKENFCTQCEAEGFRHITYFLDRPDVLATYTTTIIGDEKKHPVMLSNGNFAGEGITADGRKWIKWVDPFKKPSYLYALVAGDLELLEDTYKTTSGKIVKLKIYSEKGYGHRLLHAMEGLKKSMQWDEDNYGRECDLDEYKIVAVSDFHIGAMENKGLNIFNALYLLASPESATDDDYFEVILTLGHEYFHNWTGNRVTCNNWFQLSLKEGLTSFREQSFGEDISSVAQRIADVDFLRNKQFAEDSGPLSHPVQPQSYMAIDNFYTYTIYRKGAEIFRMLQTYLGKDTFRKGMDFYFKEYDGQAVAIEHFFKAMETTSSKDLSQFLLWFYQAGTPVLDVTDKYNQEAKTYTLKIKQSCSPTPGQQDKKPLPIPLRIGLLDKSGQVISLMLDDVDKTNETVLLITQAEQEFIFKNIHEKPTPSLLRHFSAPVKLNYQYSDNDLRLLSTHDTDLFNQWSACNLYIKNYLSQLIRSYQITETVNISTDFIDMFRTLLNSKQSDLTMLSMMLTIPSEEDLALAMETVDVNAIVKVRAAVVATLAHQLKEPLLEIYNKCAAEEKYDGKYDSKGAGFRSLKNCCLEYLVHINDQEITKFAYRQFLKGLSCNMTDAFAAMRSLKNKDCAERNIVLDMFYQKWKADPIVIIKWFGVQASSPLPSTLETVKKLMKDDAFDIKNPNIVRSLLRPFCRNFACFHAANGNGYQFLVDVIFQLDPINAKLAAEFAEFFSNWKKFADPQKNLMYEHLCTLANKDGISQHLYEIVSKSLGQNVVRPIELVGESIPLIDETFNASFAATVTQVPGTLYSRGNNIQNKDDGPENDSCCNTM